MILETSLAGNSVEHFLDLNAQPKAKGNMSHIRALRTSDVSSIEDTEKKKSPYFHQ